MSSSWFNISGNLSSIASNVSNFTKEVLHDAANNKSYEDNNYSQPQYDQNPPIAEDTYQSPDDLLHQIAYLQNELQTISNDNTYKNEQIYYLQSECEETKKQHDTHLENLKQNLLEKEKEIEQLSTKNYELESKVQQKDTFNYDMNADWNNDWGNDNGTQDIDDLKFQNECLANDVAMKEMVISAIETKMFDICNSNQEASNFSEWMDGILEEKMYIENQWKELCLMIDKYGVTGSSDENYLENVDEWIGKLIVEKDSLEHDNKRYNDIISNIEGSVSKHSDGYDNFKIADFSEWLDSLGNNDINYIFYNDSSKNMMEQIQTEIREFDDDDGDFQIENFSEWLEKVQCRIDDLEVEVINEQETREGEEKLRIQERETLNDLFKQKQNEISLLKVELYNYKSSHTLNPIVEYDQEELMTVHEQLNEMTARCEAIQHELATAHKQISESGDTPEQLKVLTADYEHIKQQLSETELELSEFKEQYNLLSQEFSDRYEESEDWKSKYQLLQSSETSTTELTKQLDNMTAHNASLTDEIQNSQLSKENMQAELDEFKIKYDSVSAEFDRVSKEYVEVTEAHQCSETASRNLQVQVDNLSAINDCIKEQLLTAESSKESVQAESSEMKIRYDSMSTQVDQLTSDLKEATNRYELLQAAETVSDSLQLQLNNLSADKDHLKEQLLSSESSKEGVHAELNELKTKYNSISVEFEEVSSALNKLQAKGDLLESKESELVALQMQFSEQSFQLIEVTSEYEKLKKTNTGFSEELQRVSNELFDEDKAKKNMEVELQDIKTEYNLLKLVQLQTEEQKKTLQCDFNAALKEQTDANEKMIDSIGGTDGDLTLMATLVTNTINETLQPFDLDVSISSEKSVMLFGGIKDLVEKYTVLCRQCDELNVVIDEYKRKLLDQESRMEEHKNMYNILVHVLNSIDNILPQDRKGTIIVNDTLCSTDLSSYVSYIQSLEEFVRNINEKEVNCLKLNNDHREEVEKMENLLQVEKAAKEEHMSKLDTFNKTIQIKLQDYKNTIDNLKLQLKESAENQKVEECKQTASGGGGGGGGRGGDSGGMKFGAIKRKLQDLEAANKSLAEENEELKNNSFSGGAVTTDFSNVPHELKTLQRELSDKKQECECYKEECTLLKSTFLEMQEQITVADSAHAECKLLKEKLLEYENMIATASNVPDETSVANRHHQDQLHNLSLMLTEKNEEIERYQAETNHLKSKLLEVENEISDLELIREECKQLKAMLVGKEHQSKVDDTITMLQQESKQLKLILSEKDTEVQYMQNIILEKENELSNMELIREECKQLKHMLVTNGSQQPSPPMPNENELRAKDAEIVELRNSNSDMELLREECRQLKQMLLNSSSHSMSESSSKDTTENVSCQLLEAMLEDRDVQISQNDVTIAELQNKLSEMNSLQDECKQLKDMLVGREDTTDLSSTLGPAATSHTELLENNSFVEQLQQLEEFVKEKDEELKKKEKELEVLTAQVNEKDIVISDFDCIQNECKILKGYLTAKEKVLVELQDDLDNANVALQQKNSDVKTKESSCVELEQRIEEAMNVISAKDSEIRKLNEEVSDSMAQDETLHLLQTEYRNVEEHLKETENDLERTEGQLHRANESLSERENECERLKLYVEQYNQLSVMLQQKDEEVAMVRLQSTENSIMESDTVNRLQQQVEKLSTLLHESGQKNDEFSKELEEKNTLLHESRQKNDEFSKKLQERNVELENVNFSCNNLKNVIVSKDDNCERTKIEKENLESEKETLLQLCSDKEENVQSLEGKVVKLEREISKYANETSTLKSQINVFEKTIKENESAIIEGSIECTNCHYLDTERKMIISILENIEKILDLSVDRYQLQNGTYSIIEHLSTLETCLRNLLINIHRKVLETSSSSESEKWNYDRNITEKDTLIAVWNTLVTTLDKKAEENVSLFSEQENTSTLKIQDLQSQLVENNEIQTLYHTKCLEYNDLEEQFLQLQNTNKEEKRNNELVVNSKVQEELELLRSELERSAHLYLNKNKECDTLKLEILQLEENVYQLKVEIGTLKGYENRVSSLETTIRNKDDEIAKLISTLEDKELIVGNSKREKQFLEQLLNEKEHLEKEKEDLEKEKENLVKEKEELRFQKEQNDRVVHEKEVLLRHKDVTLKELEARTNRELERLRNHMMMTEESHTKDILELQDREEALQYELEDVKQGLSKKAIILQDSSKQFQDHCVDLEEQLHSLSSQRDSLMMELSQCQDKISEDAMAIYNLQNALEQLQKEKFEQSDYWSSLSKRKEIENESRIEELTEELSKIQGAMSEASLAVQGINKLNLELQQKENELKVSKEKANELVARLNHMELERDKILESVDQKLDKSLLRNLLMKYFQSADDKRAEILKVIGGLLGWSAVEILELGSGAAPSKLGGWISGWAYGSPRKTPTVSRQVSRNATPVTTPTYDPNKSLSELFVKFLENETTTKKPVDSSSSLTLNNVSAPNIHMFVSPTTPDILASHNNSQEQRIPAPGQEIPRVHTHHAQSTLKSILTTTPY